MAKSPQKASKSETLTIRLDPKTRFILEYMSRLKGQTITTVVERAIYSSATSETFQTENGSGYVNWQAFWDVSEGARAINVARQPEFFPTFEEEKRVAFCEEHWPFFFVDSNKVRFRYSSMNILWPRIDEFVEIHDERPQADYWAAGKAMKAALSEADLKPPEWPIKPTVKTPPKKPDLDDEIPF